MIKALVKELFIQHGDGWSAGFVGTLMLDDFGWKEMLDDMLV